MIGVSDTALFGGGGSGRLRCLAWPLITPPFFLSVVNAAYVGVGFGYQEASFE